MRRALTRAALLLLAAAGPAGADGKPADLTILPSTFPMVPDLRSGIEPQQPAPQYTPTKPDADLAFGAFQRGYFATALTEAMERLKTNPKDAAAMALVAEIYSQGLAVRRDLAEAAKWNRLASDLGNREATFAYGLALLRGNGVPKDRDKAKALFETAAASGHAGAMYNLGVMAIEGDGTMRHFGVAAAWFRHAMEAGDVDAIVSLADLFKGGVGVATDPAQAAALYKRAADDRHVGAQVEYAIMLFNGEGVAKDEAEAAKYFLKAAYSGNPIAEDRLARLYAAGRGIGRDAVEAARWHVLAQAAGVTDPWLDGELATLTAADRLRVEDMVRKQIGR